MSKYLVALKHFDNTVFDGVWVDIERIVIADNETQIEEWASDLGWQIMSVICLDDLPLRASVQAGLRTITL